MAKNNDIWLDLYLRKCQKDSPSYYVNKLKKEREEEESPKKKREKVKRRNKMIIKEKKPK
jgi:hypothetical protein